MINHYPDGHNLGLDDETMEDREIERLDGVERRLRATIAALTAERDALTAQVEELREELAQARNAASVAH